jgi:hypothetical protein
MTEPSIGRVVWYRSRTGRYTVPAIITATTETLAPEGVEAGHVPALSSPTHVHLHVLTPGKPGPRATAEDFVGRKDAPVSENVGGGYQEFDVPFFEAPMVSDGKGGERHAVVSCGPRIDRYGEVEQLAGSWTWPERR